MAGRFLVDASGQGTLVGRHLGTRRTLPDLKKVAYFGHFNDVRRPEGERRGNPVLPAAEERGNLAVSAAGGIGDG